MPGVTPEWMHLNSMIQVHEKIRCSCVSVVTRQAAACLQHSALGAKTFRDLPPSTFPLLTTFLPTAPPSPASPAPYTGPRFTSSSRIIPIALLSASYITPLPTISATAIIVASRHKSISAADPSPLHRTVGQNTPPAASGTPSVTRAKRSGSFHGRIWFFPAAALRVLTWTRTPSGWRKGAFLGDDKGGSVGDWGRSIRGERWGPVDREFHLQMFGMFRHGKWDG